MKHGSTTRLPQSSRARREDPSLRIEPFGPTPEQVQSIAQLVTKNRAVQKYLAKTRYRLLRIDLLDSPEDPKPARPKPPDRFRAVFFDYTNNRSVLAAGKLAKPATLEVTESALQPLPS